MKRIVESRKLFGITKDVDLKELKKIYRDLVKEWHPDKFQEEEQKEEAEMKSKSIISAYHFLVSISPETHKLNAEDYLSTTTSGINDFIYKGVTLKIIFMDGSEYEYFGVQKNTYLKFINSSTQLRFARRHIFDSYIYRNISKNKADKG